MPFKVNELPRRDPDSAPDSPRFPIPDSQQGTVAIHINRATFKNEARVETRDIEDSRHGSGNSVVQIPVGISRPRR
jgi:hypothetical protein